MGSRRRKKAREARKSVVVKARKRAVERVIRSVVRRVEVAKRAKRRMGGRERIVWRAMRVCGACVVSANAEVDSRM